MMHEPEARENRERFGSAAFQVPGAVAVGGKINRRGPQQLMEGTKFSATLLATLKSRIAPCRHRHRRRRRRSESWSICRKIANPTGRRGGNWILTMAPFI